MGKAMRRGGGEMEREEVGEAKMRGEEEGQRDKKRRGEEVKMKGTEGSRTEHREGRLVERKYDLSETKLAEDTQCD